MQKTGKVSEELQLTKTLSELIKTYEEIYMLKMYKTRHSILNTREYYVRISKLYQSMKNNYKRGLIDKLKGKESDEIFNVVKKIKGSVAVFMTGNDRFAGEVNNKVFEDFLDYFRENKPDIVIIGSLGRNLFRQRAPRLKYQYFDLAESFVSADAKELESIVNYLIDYKEVRVFHGEFENMMNQEAVNHSITGEAGAFGEEYSQVMQGKDYYLFEPELKEIMLFFETQIFTSLFKRGVDESTLAQIGSRVKTLEQSTTQIDKRLKLLKFMDIKEKKKAKNAKQQASIVSINFWGGDAR